MREKLGYKGLVRTYNGITPACAGKTLALVPLLQKSQDHPRVCGKNFGKAMIGLLSVGSPPRVREKRQDGIFGIFNVGITPACAGKTRSLKHSLLQTWDHPRVCGKNQKVKVESKDKEGSPPRVREKLF